MSDPTAPARKVVLSLHMSLDGVVSEPAWTAPYRADDIAAYKHRELFDADLLLLGRVTCQGFAAAWPGTEGTGDFGERMNSLPKLVASTTLSTPEWNARLVGEGILDEVARLRRQQGQDILTYGSGTFARTLMRHGLIDEYRFLVSPVVLGTGRKLFDEHSPPLTLVLTDTQPFSSGVVGLTYRPALPSKV